MSEGIFDPSTTIDDISNIIPTETIKETIKETITSELNITELNSDIISIIMVLLLLSIILLSYTYIKRKDDIKEI